VGPECLEALRFEVLLLVLLPFLPLFLLVERGRLPGRAVQVRVRCQPGPPCCPVLARRVADRRRCG